MEFKVCFSIAISDRLVPISAEISTIVPAIRIPLSPLVGSTNMKQVHNVFPLAPLQTSTGAQRVLRPAGPVPTRLRTVNYHRKVVDIDRFVWDSNLISKG